MKHLIRIEDLSVEEIKSLVSRALSNPPFNDRREQRNPAVALIFLEPSTRTRISFERACQNLSLDYVLLDAKGSSMEKEETLADTLLNLRSMGINIFVIRTKEERAFPELKALGNLHLINAGEGKISHPTQALLDLCTLVSVWGGFEKVSSKTLTIFGDLKHSRVARSWAELAPKVGIKLQFCAPAHAFPVEWGSEFEKFEDKNAALKNSDAVMALRVQKERHVTNGAAHNWSDYPEKFQIHPNDLRADQFLLHPGPVNWGVELHPEFQKDSRSLILYQVKMGIYLRATVLDSIIGDRD